MKNTKKNNEIWVEKCINILNMGGKSNKTIINYKSAWYRFFKFYDKDTYISKLKDEDISNYFYMEFTEKRRCADYYNLNVCAIRFLYSICFNRELNRRLIPRSKVRKRLPTILPRDIFIKIFNEEKSLKHKCWLILAFCSGLRVEEVATIRIENIFSKDHKLKILGKGNKERFTILPDVVIKYLRLFYKSKNYSFNNGYFFKGTNNNEHLNEKTIINYFTSLKSKYSLDENITFHSLRHSFATYYLMNGGNILTLQSLMGHKSLMSTSIYIHIAQNFNELEGIKYV